MSAAARRRADVAYSRIRRSDQRCPGERRREAVRAGARRPALPGRRSEAYSARLWPRDARARVQGRLLPGAEARRVRGRRLVSDPNDALASAKAAADRLVRAKRLNACLTPTAALRKSLVTQAQAAHPSGVLYAMPVAVKDNICTLEFTTTCGSKILEAYRSPYEATAVAKLKAAGALIAGKTNCDEFAMGSSTEHSAYGRTLHPFDKTRVPGGSSGGSAALVAAGAVPPAPGPAAGGAVRQVALPHTAYAVPTYYILAPAEASSNLARYDGARYGTRFDGSADVRALYRTTRGEGFGPEVRRRILLGTYVLSSGYYDAYYRKAQQMRALIAQDFRNAFDRGVDLLFTPTTPSPAFKAGEKLNDPVAMYLSDIFTVTANLAGLPAISIPIGRIKGLPLGGQFIGQAFLEDEMLEAAYALERVVPATEEA